MIRFKICCMVILLGLPLFAAAQSDGPDARNSIKLNLTDLALRNCYLQYERALGRHTAIGLGLRVEPRGKVPLKGMLQNRYGGLDIADDFFENTRLSNLALTPEFRYYLGKRPQNGIYLAPYLRYAHFSMSWNYTFLDDDTIAHPIRFTGNANLYSAGLMVGGQWHIGQRFLVDIWVAGVSIGRMHTDLNAVVDLSDVERDDKLRLELLLEGTSINGDKLAADVSDYNVKATGTFTVPGIRAGLCIGFVF